MNNNLKKDLFDTIKKLNGTLLTIGIDDPKVLIEIDKNKNIYTSYSLKRNNKRLTKEEKNNGYVDIKISKLNKKLKNKIDYILCDVNGINIYLRQVINSSFDLVSKKIIFYGVYDEYDVDRIINKYKRYNVKVDKKIYNDSFLLIINTNKIKTNKLKKIMYCFIDFNKDILEAIGNSLMQ